ncbi:MAG: CYTH domain-containing protein [Anaerovoracaceae bacterium]
MEIELKYAIDSKDVAQRIWEDVELMKMEEPGTRETVFMKAIYFDTEDYDLARNQMAYRVRVEGDKTIASLKWNGKIEGALHTREEINIPVTNTDANPNTFDESDIGEEMVRILNGKSVHNIIEMTITRRRFRIDTQKSIFEISIDGGEINTAKGATPICEVEAEMFSGEQDELLKLGKYLCDTYNITSEKRSKYYRGLKLMGQVE